MKITKLLPISGRLLGKFDNISYHKKKIRIIFMTFDLENVFPRVSFYYCNISGAKITYCPLNGCSVSKSLILCFGILGLTPSVCFDIGLLMLDIM